MNLIKQESSAVNKYDPNFTDRLFDSFWRAMPLFPAFNIDMSVNDGAIAPKINIVENEKNFSITADMPGVPKENIDIFLDDGVLSIKSHMETESKKEEGGKIVHQERYEECYSRRIDLGDSTDVKGLSASHKDGVLSIIVPKLKGSTSESVKIHIT